MPNGPASCIDVAVDHRLLALRVAAPICNTSGTGDHCNLIRQLARRITRPNGKICPEEIDFTQWLSQPASTGGIAVVLQQPANEHPYHLGQETTFSSCPTLVALDECFEFASCGALKLDRITVIDSLPYTRKKDATTPDFRRQIREMVLHILHAKRPAAVLCMWQEREEVPSSLATFKSIGVGKKFDKPIIRFHSCHRTKRVNAFHPSYALYHRPCESAFRQLLLLEVARTCGELRGDWKEEEWMQQLRQRCQSKAKQAKPQVGYHLISSLEAISSLLIELPSRVTDSGSNVYHLLADRQISEHCSDASLCLQDIDATYGAIHPDDRDDELKIMATQAVNACKDFLTKILKAIRRRTVLLTNNGTRSTGCFNKESVRSITKTAFAALINPRQIVNDVQLFLDDFNGSFTFNHDRSRLCVPLSKLSHLFLLLAVAFEAEQGRLLSTHDHQFSATSAEQNLAADLSRISLGC